MTTRKAPARKRTKKAEPKGKAGRPRIPVDLDILQKLAGIGSTDEEMASLLGIGVSTFRERKKDPKFLAALEKGRSEVKAGLRRKQVELALSGDRTMLVWLGKQMLGQTEKTLNQVQEIAGPLVIRELGED